METKRLICGVTSWASTGALFALALGPKILWVYGGITALVVLATAVGTVFVYRRRPRS